MKFDYTMNDQHYQGLTQFGLTECIQKKHVLSYRIYSHFLCRNASGKVSVVGILSMTKTKDEIKVVPYKQWASDIRRGLSTGITNKRKPADVEILTYGR